MINTQSIENFYKFAIENGFIVVQDNYDCYILSNYLASIKKKFEDSLLNIIQEAGYLEIATPLFVHEDLYFSQKKDTARYKDYNTPALLYKGGFRLKKAFVAPKSIEMFTKILFEKEVHSYRELPYKVFSRTLLFNSYSFSEIFIKSLEYSTLELVCYTEVEHIKNEIDSLSNLLKDFFSIFKIQLENKVCSQESIYFTKVDDKEIVLCRYEWSVNENVENSLLYTKKNGTTNCPLCLRCEISEALFWYFLISNFDGLGVILPVSFVPYDVVLIPISINHDEQLSNYIVEIEEWLKANNIRFITDDSKKDSVGEKHFKWEKAGIPLRIEIGERERHGRRITIINRYTKERIENCKISVILDYINDVLNYWR